MAGEKQGNIDVEGGGGAKGTPSTAPTPVKYTTTGSAPAPAARRSPNSSAHIATVRSVDKIASVVGCELLGRGDTSACRQRAQEAFR
jgi:hypothetical protein